jgi:tetratricopeptide (TPR) repeat protein
MVLIMSQRPSEFNQSPDKKQQLDISNAEQQNDMPPPQCAPGEEPGLRISITYSEPSLGRSRSEAEHSEEGDLFLNAYKMGREHYSHERFGPALVCYRTALQCKNKLIHSEPKEIKYVYSNILFDIGMIHFRFHDWVKSREAFYYCLDVRRVFLGNNHPLVASVLLQLGQVHNALDEPQYALELLIEAHSILLLSAPEDKQAMIAVWNAMGNVQKGLGMIEDAESSFQEARNLSS